MCQCLGPRYGSGGSNPKTRSPKIIICSDWTRDDPQKKHSALIADDGDRRQADEHNSPRHDLAEGTGLPVTQSARGPTSGKVIIARWEQEDHQSTSNIVYAIDSAHEVHAILENGRFFQP